MNVYRNRDGQLELIGTASIKFLLDEPFPTIFKTSRLLEIKIGDSERELTEPVFLRCSGLVETLTSYVARLGKKLSDGSVFYFTAIVVTEVEDPTFLPGFQPV